MAEQFNTLPPNTLDQIMVANAQWPTFLSEHPGAINTTIGVLIDPVSNQPWQSATVRQARREALDDSIEAGAFGYQTPTGYADFRDKAGRLVFGTEAYLQHDEILSYQAIGGTNALKVAKEVLETLVKKDEKGRIPFVLDSGWPNHRAIFTEPFEITDYPHVDPKTGSYNHQAALDAFSDAPEGSVFLLQTCGYNDDGKDRTLDQWDEVLDIAQDKKAVVLLDSAYMGLVNGYESERYPIEQSVERGLLTLVSFSASKNMGLYNERLGALFFANAKQNIGKDQFSRLHQLASIAVRANFSSPPLVVAKAAAVALGHESYFAELKEARLRLRENRSIFADITRDVLPGVDEGGGLFTKVLPGGFNATQQTLLAEAGIHALPNSRINLGGIHLDQVERVGLAVMRVLRTNNS